MATDPYRGLATERPVGAAGEPFQNIHAVPRPVGGRETAQAIEQVGQAGQRVGAFFGDVAADDAANQYQERMNELLYGNPQKMAPGPDGKPVPDTGFMGLKGRAAMDARPEVDRRMEEIRREILSGLKSPLMSQRFNAVSRREKSISERHVGAHADAQANAWYGQVNKATIDNGNQHVARHADNPEEVTRGYDMILEGYTKQAQLMGGGPELLKQARDRAHRDAVSAQASAIGVNDPARAMRIIENNKGQLGTQYDELANRFRARAEVADGRAVADERLTGMRPEAKGVLEQGTEALKAQGINIAPSSTVRTPGQNAAVGGAHDSEHLHGGAMDIPWGSKSEAEKKAILAQFAGDPRVGGIGFYDGHIHVDTKPGRRAWGAQPAWATETMAGWKGTGLGPRPMRDQSEVIAEVLNDPRLQDKPQAQAAAVARINQSYALHKNTEVRRNVEFKQRVDDTIAEARQTGAPSKPLSEYDFVQHFGYGEGQAKYADYTEELQFGADFKSLQTMSNADQDKFLGTKAPEEGKPGYARAAKNRERLYTAAKDIQQRRRDDPAGAVSRLPAVQGAVATYDPQKPETFKLVADARLAAQAELGIEEEFRSPITKAEALKETKPLMAVIPGDESRVAREVGQRFEKLFGDKADEALVYALRVHGTQARVAEQVGAVIGKLRRGETLTTRDGAAVDEARETAAAERAVTGESSGRPFLNPMPMATGPRPNPFDNTPRVRDFGFEGTPVIERPRPTPRAIEDLQKGILPAERFDKLFGTGMAKEVLRKYPLVQTP